MTHPNKEFVLEHLDDEALFLDGFDKAIIGITERCGMPTVVLYDINKCIEVLVHRNEITYEEALEHFNQNILDSYMGEYTPMFANLI